MNLRAEGLVKKYARRIVVDQVNLIVNPGEIVGLLGPNGAGKTTCFYLIVGAISSNAGHIFLGDRDITALPMYRRARLGHWVSGTGIHSFQKDDRVGKCPVRARIRENG